MTLGEQLRWWSLGFVVLVLLLWLLSGSLAPFLLGAAIAYLSDPFADRLEGAGLSRLMATIVITVIAVGAGVLFLLIVVPVLVDQVRAFIEAAPGYADQLRELVARWMPLADEPGSFAVKAVESLSTQVQNWSGSVLKSLLTGGLAVIDFVTLMFITPVVAFYLLNDWDRIIAAIDDALPRQHRQLIHRLAKELDDVLAGFVRGQLTVCVILGLFYAFSLSLIGLSFGLLVGLFAGLISFIPFVGSIVGGLLSVGIATAQFWQTPEFIVAVAIVFVIGQAVEGNFLTPKLVGGHVKLHPVWLIFALSAFGSLMGFVGMLIAVPAAAAIGVLLRFLIEQYKSGRLYRGEDGVIVAEARGGDDQRTTEAE